jgi:hypothetical protein
MFRMPRLTLFVAAAALAAAPVSARAQSSRPVDECGKPAPARGPRKPPRPATGARPAATPSAAEGPRLLGVPAGGAAADAAQTPGGATGGDAGHSSPGSATGTTHATGSATAVGPRLLGIPAAAAHDSGTPGTPTATGAGAGSTAAAGSHGAGPQGSGMSAGGTGARPAPHSSAGGDGAASQGSGTSMQAPQGSGTSAVAPQGSATSTEAARASSDGADSDFLSNGARSRPIDPRVARRNRDALQLGLSATGDRQRLGPAASVSVPTAFGVDAGEMFFGVAYQGRTRYTESSDAAAVVGIGLGTRRVVAVEAALTTYSTIRGAPLETGGVSVKVHRALPRGTSVAVGWENAIRWGGSDDDGSLYAAATKLLSLRSDAEAPFSTAVVTLGVGNGRFRFESDDAAGRQTANLFGAVGARINPQVSLVADWTGQDLNMAASITPLPRVPAVITAGLADLTGQAGDGARFILSLGYGLAFRQPF